MEKDRIKLIYLLGTSFSGSTLVGYLIGSCPEVFNAGEPMLFGKKKDIGAIPCFCGRPTRVCSVWQQMGLKGFRLYDKPAFEGKILLLIRLLTGLPLCPLFQRGHWDDERFCRRLLSQVPETVILDASKSMFRLMYLACTGAFDIKVIYIKRDLLGNISSFVKNRDSILKGLINYKLNHFFMPRLLRKMGLDFYYLSYKQLCQNPSRNLEALGGFLGLDLAYDRVKTRIQTRKFHVFTGSDTRVQFRDFRGVRYDRSWQTRLSRLEQWFIRLVSLKSER